MHQRCVICSVRSWSSAYQISWSRSLCTLSASAPKAHWSARHLLYCSCDLNVWSLYTCIFFFFSSWLFASNFSNSSCWNLGAPLVLCSIHLIFQYWPPFPPCFFFSSTYIKICVIIIIIWHLSSNPIIMVRPGQLLVLYSRHARSTHPPGNADLSNDRRQLAIFQHHSATSTSVYKTKTGKTPKKSLFIVLLNSYKILSTQLYFHKYLQICFNAALPPKSCAKQSKNYISYSNFWGNIAMFLKQW